MHKTFIAPQAVPRGKNLCRLSVAGALWEMVFMMRKKFFRLVLCALLALTSAAFAGPVSFTDSYGNVVTLASPAKRVVSLPIPLSTLLVAVNGSPDALVGMHPSTKVAVRDGMMGKMFPAMLDINSSICGSSGWVPNVEEIAALEPDLVFQWGSEGADTIEPLKNAGLTVALVRFGKQENLEEFVDIMGTALGKSDRAKDILGWMHAVRADVARRVAAVPAERRPRALSLFRARAGLKASAAGTYHGESLEFSGGANVAAHLNGYPDINVEQVLEWDPEVIVLNNFEPDVFPQLIYDNPLLADVSAVKNRRVFRAPLGGYRWDPPSQESPLMWLWLAKILLPSSFNDDLRGMMAERFKFLYNYNLSEDEMDSILWLGQNGAKSPQYRAMFGRSR